MPVSNIFAEISPSSPFPYPRYTLSTIPPLLHILQKQLSHQVASASVQL